MVVLIPAYEPDGKLVDLVRRLCQQQTVVVVDDGSGPAYSDVFSEVRGLGVDLVTLPTNCGKGVALKTGFAHVGVNYPGQDVVCADSDGQHTPDDIQAVADRLAATDAAMVLGVRHFTGKVPVRSRFGNSMTRLAYSLATGQSLVDTQTGLRAYPARMLNWLGGVRGDRFEYELRLLLQASREGLHIEEVGISTIYLERNASSHFRPLVDSFRVYGPLLAFTASSILAFVLDTVLLYVLVEFTGKVVASAVAARLVSATVNYGVNRIWVFGGRGGVASRKTSAPRYAALALGIFAVNVVMLKLLTALIGLVIIAKILTEASLFIVSYLVQKYIVFPVAASRASAARTVAGTAGGVHDPAPATVAPSLSTGASLDSGKMRPVDAAVDSGDQ